LVDPGVLAFVTGALPAPPARVLEVGAGSGELALALVARGYDVVAIDPASEGPPVVPLALQDVAEPAAGFDAAVAVVSLHHVDPLEESCRRLGELVRPGGTLAVDEFDVEIYDERAARWWLDQRAAAGHDADRDPREMVAELRDHLHSLDRIRGALAEWFELEPTVQGAYLHRWHLPRGLQGEEERLIALGDLPATGARFAGTRPSV
jgi:SAM-dependent methyltransferase